MRAFYSPARCFWWMDKAPSTLWQSHAGARLGWLAATHHLLGGEVAGKAAALAQVAVDLQARAVAQQHVLDDGQAQAGATGVAGAAGVDPVEAFGQARQGLGLDAQAGVGQRQVCTLVVGPPANADFA